MPPIIKKSKSNKKMSNNPIKELKKKVKKQKVKLTI